jgi:hypothetical protein
LELDDFVSTWGGGEIVLGLESEREKIKIGWMHAMQNGMEIMLSFSICLLARIVFYLFPRGDY